jgi:hypothetical protein
MPPSLTLKSFAEILELPLYEYVRILTEQKFPNKAPASFRVPFYQAAHSAIRRFYRSGGQVQEIQAAIANIQTSSSIETRKDNNIRVLRVFQGSPQVRRQLSLVPTSRFKWLYAGIELKYTPELLAIERHDEKYISYNFRQEPVPDNIATATLELVYSLLRANAVKVGIGDVEFVDFAQRGRVYRIQRVKQRTLKHAKDVAKAIVQLWPGI